MELPRDISSYQLVSTITGNKLTIFFLHFTLSFLFPWTATYHWSTVRSSWNYRFTRWGIIVTTHSILLILLICHTPAINENMNSWENFTPQPSRGATSSGTLAFCLYRLQTWSNELHFLLVCCLSIRLFLCTSRVLKYSSPGGQSQLSLFSREMRNEENRIIKRKTWRRNLQIQGQQSTNRY